MKIIALANYTRRGTTLALSGCRLCVLYSSQRGNYTKKILWTYRGENELDPLSFALKESKRRLSLLDQIHRQIPTIIKTYLSTAWTLYLIFTCFMYKHFDIKDQRKTRLKFPIIYNPPRYLSLIEPSSYEK